MPPPEETVSSFGQFLKRERELRKISLAEIAAYTRIKLRSLEAIEEDDFASLPPLAFVRAFIRCYADYLGLDVPDVMLQFDAFIQSRYPELTGEILLLPQKPQPQQRYLPLIFGIVVVVLLAFAYWLSRPPSSPLSELDKPRPAKKAPPPPSAELPPTSSVVSGGPAALNALNSPAVFPPPPAAGNSLSPQVPPPVSPPLPAAVQPPKPPDVTPPAPPAEKPRIVKSSPFPPEKKTPPILVSFAREPLGPPRELATMPRGKTITPQKAKLKDNPPAEETAAPKQFRHRVAIKVSKPCWIQYIIDNDKSHNYIIQPGQNLELAAADRIKIKIGNPDSVVSVSYNNEPVVFKPKCSPWWVNYPPRADDNYCP